MQIVALAGGVGGARFIRGLRTFCDELTAAPAPGGSLDVTNITIIGNTGDDITLFGLRVCPDLDTLVYTLGGGIDEHAGWGRAGDTLRVQRELAAYDAGPQWFTLGDLDLGTHIARTQWLRQGLTLSQVTAQIARRWGLPARGLHVLPMSDAPAETHVVLDADAVLALPGGGGIVPPPQPGGQVTVHFQRWWAGLGAAVPALRFTHPGLDQAAPAPGVLEAIAAADVILLPPSNPVVSIGVILSVPGIREALRAASAPVVGVSPLIGGAPVRGHADACLAALGLPATPEAVAGLYRDVLDGWLVDEHDPFDLAAARAQAPPPDRAGQNPPPANEAPGGATGQEGSTPASAASGSARRLEVRHRPLLMTGEQAAARLAGDALTFALDLAAARP